MLQNLRRIANRIDQIERGLDNLGGGDLMLGQLLDESPSGGSLSRFQTLLQSLPGPSTEGVAGEVFSRGAAGLTSPTSANSPAVSESSGGAQRYSQLIQQASEKHGVDSDLITAVIRAESNFDPSCVSSAGARGLMQLMPTTARHLGITDIHDPAQNIDGGTRYLKEQLDRFENPTLALAAYNAGPGAVQQHDGVPPYQETRQYIGRVMRYFTGLKQSAGAKDGAGTPTAGAAGGAVSNNAGAGGQNASGTEGQTSASAAGASAGTRSEAAEASSAGRLSEAAASETSGGSGSGLSSDSSPQSRASAEVMPTGGQQSDQPSTSRRRTPQASNSSANSGNGVSSMRGEASGQSTNPARKQPAPEAKASQQVSQTPEGEAAGTSRRTEQAAGRGSQSSGQPSTGTSESSGYSQARGATENMSARQQAMRGNSQIAGQTDGRVGQMKANQSFEPSWLSKPGALQAKGTQQTVPQLGQMPANPTEASSASSGAVLASAAASEQGMAGDSERRPLARGLDGSGELTGQQQSRSSQNTTRRSGGQFAGIEGPSTSTQDFQSPNAQAGSESRINADLPAPESTGPWTDSTPMAGQPIQGGDRAGTMAQTTQSSTPAKGVQQAVRQTIQQMPAPDAGPLQERVVVQLSPRELGDVVVDIHRDNDAVNVIMRTETPAAATRIQQGVEGLDSTLRDLGLKLDGFDVACDAGGSGSLPEHNEAGPQPQGPEVTQGAIPLHSAESQEPSAPSRPRRRGLDVFA